MNDTEATVEEFIVGVVTGGRTTGVVVAMVEVEIGAMVV